MRRQPLEVGEFGVVRPCQWVGGVRSVRVIGPRQCSHVLDVQEVVVVLHHRRQFGWRVRITIRDVGTLGVDPSDLIDPTVLLRFERGGDAEIPAAGLTRNDDL